MNTILQQIEKLLLHENDFIICNVLSTEGSVPTKPGSVMVVSQKGIVAGTVGGGAVELSCIELSKKLIKEKKSSVETFDLSKNSPINMTCGGKLLISFDFIDSGKTKIDELSEKYCFETKITRVIVFGAGHVGKELAKLLRYLNFDVLQFDDREEFAVNGCRLCNYQEVNEYVEIKKEDFTVVLTHGHESDATVLLQLCSLKPAFIGCIGSKNKALETKSLLLKQGIDEQVVNSICCPVGLPIGGNSPEEIAVSIAAQLIQKRSELSYLTLNVLS